MYSQLSVFGALLVFNEILCANGQPGNIQNFDEWWAENNGQNAQFHSQYDVTFSFGIDNGDTSGGRITWQGMNTGSFCYDLVDQLTSGIVFSGYLATEEPTNRAIDQWDELDFEFP